MNESFVHLCKGVTMSPVDTYRIGWTWLKGCWWRAGRKTGHPFHYLAVSILHGFRHRNAPWRDLLRRPWQAEVTLPDCSCNARRGFTRKQAAKAVWRAHLRAFGARDCWSALSEAERAAAV
jgi:hypothetical protein